MNIWPAIFTTIALCSSWLLAAMLVRAARRDPPLCVLCRKRAPISGTDECYTCWADHGVDL